MLAVLLTGDHDTMAAAELDAFCGRRSTIGTRIAMTDASVEAVGQLAFLKQASIFWGEAADTAEGLQQLARAVVQAAPGGGSAAVLTTRLGQNKSPNRNAAVAAIGAALIAKGHTIDLERPMMTVTAWFHADRIVVGLLALEGARDHEARSVQNRAHFSPISLGPRLAKGLVHLTGCKPPATIYDPFCGTGGILLEAALDGYTVLGSDRDAWMVQGTLATLADAGPEALDGDIFEADIGDAPELAGQVDGIVTDLPYGGASTSNQEELAGLYERAFAAFAQMLEPGCRAIIGHANPALLEPITRYGFEVEAVHEEYVHKSMTRRFAVVKRTS